MSRAVPIPAAAAVLPAAALAVLLAVLLAALPPAVPPAGAAGCPHRGDEVRYDDGRLLIERTERDADAATVRERWWTCWRPTGRRILMEDWRHRPGIDPLSLFGVYRGRFVVMRGGPQIDVFDARRPVRTATLPDRGWVRALVVSAAGRAAVLQDVAPGHRYLDGSDGRRACLLDAGAPDRADGTAFGDLTVHGERIQWFHDGVQMGAGLTTLSCPSG